MDNKIIAIIAISGPLKGQKYLVKSDAPVLIGRNNDTVIRTTYDIYSSRKHASVSLENGICFIEDLNSKSGTFVNNALINKKTKLQDKDTIKISQTEFVVDIHRPTKAEKNEELNQIGSRTVKIDGFIPLPQDGHVSAVDVRILDVLYDPSQYYFRFRILTSLGKEKGVIGVNRIDLRDGLFRARNILENNADKGVAGNTVISGETDSMGDRRFMVVIYYPVVKGQGGTYQITILSSAMAKIGEVFILEEEFVKQMTSIDNLLLCWDDNLVNNDEESPIPKSLIVCKYCKKIIDISYSTCPYCKRKCKHVLRDDGASAKQIIVVGDVHGEIDGLLEILKKARLIDKNGDWLGKDSILVQMGDVIDRGDYSWKAFELLQKLQSQARNSHGNVVRLLGNHELMLLEGNYRHANFENPENMAELIKQDVINGDVVAAYFQCNRLFVHGGLVSRMRELLEQEAQNKGYLTIVSQEAMAEYTNNLLIDALKNKDFSHPLFQADKARGGSAPFPGIFWCDYETLQSSAEAGRIKQIVGHTPDSVIRYTDSRGRINVDAGMVKNFGGNRAFLKILDCVKFIIVFKIGNKWEEEIIAEFDKNEE